MVACTRLFFVRIRLTNRMSSCTQFIFAFGQGPQNFSVGRQILIACSGLVKMSYSFSVEVSNFYQSYEGNL